MMFCECSTFCSFGLPGRVSFSWLICCAADRGITRLRQADQDFSKRFQRMIGRSVREDRSIW